MGKLLVELSKEIPNVVSHPKRPQAVFTIRENTFANVMHEIKSPKEALNELKEQIARER